VVFNQTITANTIFTINPLGSFETQFGAQLLGATIVRVRGVMFAEATAAPLAGSHQPLVLGMRIVDEAEATPLVAQSPTVDLHADWFVYEPFYASMSTLSDTNGWKFDSQSSRKLEELGQGVRMSVGNSGGPTIVFSSVISLGLKLA